jgi:sensor histidine kinase YesM
MPFVLLWALFAAGRREGIVALVSGVLGVAPAAALGLLVWRVPAIVAWPAAISLKFYLVHLALATTYGAAWVLSTRTIRALETGRFIPGELLGSRMGLMQLLTGIALYGVVAGASYAGRISRDLRRKEQDAAAARTLAVSAKLDALRAQLNPHFLFNALHSLGALVRYDQAAAQHAIEELAEMLRYSLRADGTDVVSLQQEWEFTTRYLAFQKLRFGHRLRVEAAISEATLRRCLPAFAIQTLVENAVRHAVEENVSGGTVVVHAIMSNGTLVVSVRDEGGGSGAPRPKGTGTGVARLRERLQALYGDRATLLQYPTDAGGFAAELRLPQATDEPPAGGVT